MGLSIGGFNGKRLADIRNISVHGQSGCGVYVLYIILKATVTKLSSEAYVSQLTSSIVLNEPSLKVASGIIDGQPVHRWTEFSTEEQLGFSYYLSASQLNAIEVARCNGDLKLGIWLAGNTDYEGKNESFNGKGDFIVPKQQWLEALASMGYKDTLLFELPMPQESGKIKDSLRDLLERSQNHILNGNYQESIGLCRQAIEFVEKSRKDKKKSSAASKKYQENRQEMNVIERMLFLREGLKNITQLGAHHSEDFSRQQAQAVLGMTVALLSSPEIGIH